MKERPILFSAPMVRAILAGTKTQTRRLMKPQPETQHDGEPYWHVGGYRVWGYRPPSAVPLRAGGNPLPCPYGVPGDRLWVRETWAPLTKGFAYSADPIYNYSPAGRWTSSIHMPRTASRITLEVTGVRVERLQDISKGDALAEGIVPAGDGNGFQLADTTHYGGNPIDSYLSLWESINGPGSSAANPWVWVVEFLRLEQTA